MAFDPTKVRAFHGLNNTTDPMRLGTDWLTLADNVNITDTGALAARGGYSRSLTGTFTGAYATLDQSRMYLVDGGALKAATGSAASPVLVTLRTGLSSAPMHFTEINDQVFFNNGTDSGVILPDNTVLDWIWAIPAEPAVAAVTGSLPAGLYRVACTFTLADGRQTGASDIAEIVLAEGQALQVSAIPQLAGGSTSVWIAPANSTVFSLAAASAGTAMVWGASPDDLGIELMDASCMPLPTGCDIVQAWKGRLYAAQYFPELDQSAVWCSLPLGFHLFDLARDGFLVPGRVLMLAPHDTALIVGTDKAIHAYTAEGMALLAPYGVSPGWHWSEDDDKTVLFWSMRGVCRALPFSNLTERFVSVAPGVSAGGAIVRRGGQKRFVAAIQQGGSAFNQH